MPSPKAEPVILSDEERSVLLGWSRRRKTVQALALRARIILSCAEGGTNGEVAEAVGVGRQTVSKWRARFLAQRLEGLGDEPRPGRLRVIGDEKVEALIATTLEEVPANGDSHWSTRSMASQAGLSQSAVSRIWRAFGLKPHAVQSWKLSTDPLFVDKVRDVVGLYMAPPENALVLAVDEKSNIQALDRSAPVLPLAPGGGDLIQGSSQDQEVVGGGERTGVTRAQHHRQVVPLLEAHRIATTARAQGRDTLTGDELATIAKLNTGARPHRYPATDTSILAGHARTLATRFAAHREVILRFTTNLTVGFTNNAAEGVCRELRVRVGVTSAASSRGLEEITCEHAN
jgi:transposase